MTVKTKFRVSAGLAILSSGLILAIVVWSFLSLRDSERQRDFAASLNSELISLHLLTTELAFHPSARVRQQWRIQYAMLSETLSETDDGARRLRVLMTELNRRHESLGRLYDRLIEETPDPESRLPGEDETTRLVYASILAQLAAMHSLSRQVLRASEVAAATVLNQVWYAVSLGILVVIACNAYVFFQFMPKLVEPILRLRDAIETIGQGDLHFQVWSERRDEIGDVFREVERMRRSLLSSTLELKELNANLSEAKARLERRGVQLEAVNRELEAFAYSVSHDLRAPLRGIDGFSEALVEDYGDRFDGNARDYISRIRAGCKRMGQLIDDLLTLSRVTRATLKPIEVDLSALVETMVSKLREQEPRRRIETEIAPGLVVDGDPGLLQIVVENLLENAWKFTSLEEQARVEFGATETNEERVLYVRDNGVGVDMRFADKLFKPFQRLHRDSDFPGTGIGLATVARVIHRHGGRVWARSPEGEGMTVYFTLGRGATTGG